MNYAFSNSGYSFVVRSYISVAVAAVLMKPTRVSVAYFVSEIPDMFCLRGDFFCMRSVLNKPSSSCLVTVKAKMWAISSDTHQLHYTPKQHFII